MANRIRGKKRQEIIDNWLKGVEEPDVEVLPTKSDGRYIVRPKNTSTMQDKNVKEEAEQVEEKKEETKPKKDNRPATKTKHQENEDTSYRAKQGIKSSDEYEYRAKRGYESSDEYEYEYEYEEEEPERVDKLQLEILNELKRMNAEKQQHRAEKARRKELKQAVQHQLYKSAVFQQPERSNLQPPQRRRLNLLKRVL